MPATIPVTIAYELHGLDANLRPGELIMAVRRQLPDFPYLDTILVKQEAVKEWLCIGRAHTNEIYCICHVLRPGSEVLIFSYEGYLEPDSETLRHRLAVGYHSTARRRDCLVSRTTKLIDRYEMALPGAACRHRH